MSVTTVSTDPSTGVRDRGTGMGFAKTGDADGVVRPVTPPTVVLVAAQLVTVPGVSLPAARADDSPLYPRLRCW